MKFREAAIVSGGLLVQQATVFATGIIVARQLGAGDFGTLGTLKSLSTVLVILTPLGLDLALLKHASFYRERLSELKATSRALRVVAAAINVLLLVLVAAWLGPALQHIYREIPDFSNLCVITMLGLVFAADIQISGALYRVFDRVVLYALIVNYGQPVLRLVLSCLVLLAGFGLQGIVWVNTMALLGTYLVIFCYDRKDRAPALSVRARPLAAKVGAILSESLWMAMSLLVYQAMRLADIIVLAAMTTPQITGEYTAMSSVAQLIQIYPTALSQTLGPRIALFYRQGDTTGVVTELRSYLRKASMLGGYLFGGVAVFGTDLDLVFGKGFDFSWMLAFFLATGWYVSATLAPLGYVLSMTGRHRQEVAILSAGAATLIICLMVLIPPLAAVGAALAVAIAFALVNMGRAAYVIKVLGVNPLQLKDLTPPIAFLVSAFLCRQLGALIGDRRLATLVLECAAYSALAAVVLLALLANAAERQALSEVLGRKRRMT